MRDYYEPQDVPCIRTIGKSQPIAAKEHKCGMCSLPIPKGTKHNKHILINDDEGGRLEQFRFHLICPWELEAQSAQSEK